MRNALRNLARAPSFTAIAIVTLALGIGLNTSMFSLMNLLILDPLPYPDRQQLVKIFATTPKGQAATHTGADVTELKHELTGIPIATTRMWGFTMARNDRPPVNLNALRVSANFFPVLGLPPELGRYFNADEDRVGNHVIVLSHATWQAQFGGDPSIVGSTVRIDGEPTTIIGVTPAAMSSVFLWGPGDAFRPMAETEYERRDKTYPTVSIIARLPAGMTIAQFNAQLRTVGKRLAEHRPNARSEDSLRAISLEESSRVPAAAGISWALLGLAASVLLIACANLANLQLARTIARAQEFAIRSALGASLRRLLQPVLTESLILAFAGGGLGIIIALWANDWMSSRLSETGIVAFTVALNWRVVAFAVVVSTVTGVAFGLVPTFVLSHLRVIDVLKSGTRGNTGGPAQHRVRHVLIIAQFALTLVLLSSAVLFIRGFQRVLDRELGWQRHGLLRGTLSLPQSRYETGAKQYAFHQQLQQRLAALPGVENATIAWTLPEFLYLTSRSYIAEAHEAPPAGHEPTASVNAVMPSFLPTLKIRLLRGRNFTDADTMTTRHVAIINEAMARAMFPNENPIGRRIGSPDPSNRAWVEVVGVMADTQFALSAAAPQTQFVVYVPLAQETWAYVSFALRAPHPERYADSAREVVNQLDHDLPIQQLNTVDETIKRAGSSAYMMNTLLTGFAGLGLFLAALGLYGVTTRLVTQRMPELGVRMALGAQRHDVVWLVLRAAIKLALFGAVIGLMMSFGMAKILARVTTTAATAQDPLLIGAMTLVLLIVATIAGLLPALRAGRIDPLTALRND